jgi:diguanylate cyclase (GGDEF)-like protein/PAS domain S-box-containing protein
MIRILLIDNSPDDLALAERELRRYFNHLEVSKAADEENFNQVLHQESFDAVVTDYQLRWSNGIRILETVKRKHPNCPVIMFTNSGNQEVAVEAMKSGLDDYVLKAPRRYSRLPTAIKLAIDRARERRKISQLSARLDSLLNQLEIGVFRASVDGQLQEANHAFINLLKIDSQAIQATNLNAVFPHRKLKTFSKPENLNNDSHTWEGQLCCADGALRWVKWSEKITNQNGEIFIDGLAEDISDRKINEVALETSEKLYRLVTESSRDLIALNDFDGKYIYVSPSCKLLLGFTQEELLGSNFYEILHPLDRSNPRLNRENILSGENSTLITYRVRCKSGEYIWLETLVKPIWDKSNRITYLQSVSRDITERIHFQRQLENAVLFDSLTQLPNRALFIDRIDYTISQVQQSNYSFAILLIDIDHFKRINDSLGHSIGDQLLQAISIRLQRCIRKVDTLARLGGDEFGILISKIEDISEPIEISQNIKDILSQPFPFINLNLEITASIGIVLATQDYDNSSALLRDADISMYRAKASGRAKYEIFNSAMHQEVLTRLELEHELHRAIENQEFTLYYQPKIRLDTGHLVGFEALVRWQHPTKGILLPNSFISVAEDSDLILFWGEWILLEACQQMYKWQQEYPEVLDLCISVNVTAKQVQQECFKDQVGSILSQTKLDGHHLHLEVTESVLLTDIDGIRSTFKALKEIGIKICIDDFGTGYSSLTYLQSFPIDVLKIDKTFIDRIEPSSSEDSEAIGVIKAILDLVKTLKMTAVAEGIETKHQMQWLQNLGCDIGQGYLFGRPLTLHQASDLIRRSTHN